MYGTTLAITNNHDDASLYQNADGTPIDLTGYTVRSQIRQRVGGDLVAEFECGFVDAAQGIIVRRLSGAISGTLPVTSTKFDCATLLWSDLEIRSPSGKVTTILKAQQLNVMPEVTKP